MVKTKLRWLTSITPDTLPNDRAPLNFYAQVSVIKTDEEGKLLAGAEFTLYDRFDIEIAKAISDSDGIAWFGNIVNGLWYKIKETKAPIGYELNADEILFSVTSVEPLTYTVLIEEARLNWASISIYKTDDKGSTLGNAEFTLYDTEGKALETVITQSDGTAYFTDIPVGSYTIKETRAPLGYTSDSSGVSVEVGSIEVVALTFINTDTDEL